MLVNQRKHHNYASVGLVCVDTATVQRKGSNMGSGRLVVGRPNRTVAKFLQRLGIVFTDYERTTRFRAPG